MPAFFDGQLTLVGNEFASDGQIGIFAVNGDGYIKELHGQRLHSLNPKYEDIPFNVKFGSYFFLTILVLFFPLNTGD